MAKRKKQFVFTSAHLARVGSVAGILFVLTVVFSFNTHLRFLAFGIDYVFGISGLFVLGAAMIAAFLYSLIVPTGKRIPVRFILGTLFLFFGLYILFPFLGFAGKEDPNNLKLVTDAFDQAYHSVGTGLISDLKLGGGVPGYLLEAFLFKSGGIALVLSISIVLLLLSANFYFWPLIIKLFRFARARIAINKANKKKAKQEEAAASVSPFGIPMPEENITPEVNDYEPPIPQEDYRMPVKDSYSDPAPVSMPNFAPASRTLFPSRRSLRVGANEGRTMPQAIESKPIEAPSPDRPFVASTPLRTSGFHKAYFGVVPPEMSEEVVIPVVEEKPRKVMAPVSIDGIFEQEDSQTPVANEPPVQESVPEVPAFEVAAPSYLTPTPEPKNEPVAPINVPSAPLVEERPEPRQEEPQPEIIAAPSFVTEPVPSIEPAIVVPPAQAPAVPPSPAPAAEPEPEPVVSAPEAPKAKDPLAEEEAEELPPYQLPSIDLLQDVENAQDLEEMERDCQVKEAIINKAYADLKAGAHVVGHIIGPSVTQFSIQPDDDVSVSTLGRFQKDLELRLGGLPTRFAERVSGMSYCALEVANAVCRTISFKELFTGMPPLNGKNNMLVPFGEDITGKVRYADLTELPHMLVAGTTGSGKSVFIHGLLFSLLMRNRPEELKLVLVDPKRVEMNKYRDLPHLLCPIIKEPSEAKVALKKLCDEMDRRFKVFENANVQSIRDYNDDYCEYAHKKKMPFIVVVIDEFADLVGAEKEVSDHVLRIGQKARAAGIHMIIATQRPDVKIITGTIKSNLPTRIALTVASTVDSQTILGVKGAEELNGKGDMLIDCVQVAKKEFVRAQGAFVTSRDMRVIGDFIRNQMGPKYDPDFLDLTEKEEEIPGSASSGGGAPIDMGVSESTLGAIKAAGDEEKYQMIKAEVMKREYTSISQIQRDYSVGFPRAGKIYSRLLKEGIISLDSPNSSRGAKVVVHASETPDEENPGASSDNTTTSWSEEY